MDCGPACLQMIARYHGRHFSLGSLRDKAFITRNGVSLQGICDAAESINMRPTGVRISFSQLLAKAPLPCIVHWSQNHFVVVFKITKNKIYVADPAFGRISYTKERFLEKWISAQQSGEAKGIALLLEPGADFYKQPGDEIKKTSFRFLFTYLKPHKKFIWQLLLGLLAGSVLQLIFPFLTQAVVDIGINTKDINFIYLILIAQLTLMAGRMSVEFIRSWILLHISTRLNISLISDFLVKLMKLPIGFFDSKLIGDIIQRIGDHSRIERFLTSQSLTFLFSIFNILIFGLVLLLFNLKIFLIFVAGTGLYVLWVIAFLRKRKEIDFMRFKEKAVEKANLVQLIEGMQEIKLNHCERQKRWEWEDIQAKLFRVSIKSLSLNQYQHLGGLFFNETKNILITIMAATAVINGQMTLGEMLAVQYIIGQLNSPVDQMIQFMQTAQDARLSLERLGEIHEKDDEEQEGMHMLHELPAEKALKMEHVTYRYGGPNSPKALNNVSIQIHEGEITAVVGTSGSGKTTLLKLLLGFYPPVSGNIKIGNTSLLNFSQSWWRDQCGAVMQDGFIFSDTIAGNIALRDDPPDRKRLLHAVQVAHIQDFIESLPLGYNTKIGQEGMGLSQGQKQRILIARVVYKNPGYLFFDEATNALDANNEKTIMENLSQFFHGRTVVIVAHRLSTVKNAGQIVVLDKGSIIESGTHTDLVEKKGHYYQLIKNQLELGT